MKKNKKNKKAFLVLIAIVVSMILLSIGMFIATIAVQEIKISSSLKESQKAFYAADSVLECALLKEFRGEGFGVLKLTSHDLDHSLECNNYNFDWYSSYDDGDIVKDVYFISLGDLTGFDTDSNGIISRDEMKSGYLRISKEPYVKLIVYKKKDWMNADADEWTTKLQAYGHNYMLGKGIIERAIEILW